jgi:hypothetical protein
MHDIEPYYNWRLLYTAEEDKRSPFYERVYSEFEFTDKIYNYVIHPQWDNIGSTTLFIKLLYVSYDDGFCIIEFIGEWNDCLYNDIMTLKRNIIDHLTYEGIQKFILLVDNVLNFHHSDDSYYEEWFEDVEDGWIALLNARKHVLEDIQYAGIDQYLLMGGELNETSWRTYAPEQLFNKINKIAEMRLGV